MIKLRCNLLDIQQNGTTMEETASAVGNDRSDFM
jgi:hypothetical protein